MIMKMISPDAAELVDLEMSETDRAGTPPGTSLINPEHFDEILEVARGSYHANARIYLVEGETTAESAIGETLESVQAALNLGGDIIIDGSISYAGQLVIPANCHVIGINDAEINFIPTTPTNSSGFKTTNPDNISIKDIKITGKPIYALWVLATSLAKCITLENIRLECDAEATGAIVDTGFRFDANVNGIIRNMRVTDCVAYYHPRHGFAHVGDGTFENVIYENCEAVGCGTTGRLTAYTAGFLVSSSSTITLKNVKYINCDSSYSLENGFHSEQGTHATDLFFSNCTASYNGQKENAFYGHGFLLVGQDFRADGCIAHHNVGSGFWILGLVDLYSSGVLHGTSYENGKHGLIVQYGDSLVVDLLSKDDAEDSFFMYDGDMKNSRVKLLSVRPGKRAWYVRDVHTVTNCVLDIEAINPTGYQYRGLELRNIIGCDVNIKYNTLNSMFIYLEGFQSSVVRMFANMPTGAEIKTMDIYGVLDDGNSTFDLKSIGGYINLSGIHNNSVFRADVSNSLSFGVRGDNIVSGTAILDNRVSLFRALGDVEVKDTNSYITIL